MKYTIGIYLSMLFTTVSLFSIQKNFIDAIKNNSVEEVERFIKGEFTASEKEELLDYARKAVKLGEKQARMFHPKDIVKLVSGALLAITGVAMGAYFEGRRTRTLPEKIEIVKIAQTIASRSVRAHLEQEERELEREKLMASLAASAFVISSAMGMAIFGSGFSKESTRDHLRRAKLIEYLIKGITLQS